MHLLVRLGSKDDHNLLKIYNFSLLPSLFDYTVLLNTLTARAQADLNNGFGNGVFPLFPPLINFIAAGGGGPSRKAEKYAWHMSQTLQSNETSFHSWGKTEKVEGGQN